MCVFVKEIQTNGCTDFDAMFAKQLLTALPRILLKSINLDHRSRSLSSEMYLKRKIGIGQNLKKVTLERKGKG